jgi:N-acetylmuramoyl-L-alanine amidase
MKQYAETVDLFFSVHHNAATSEARGAEILAQIADKDGGPTQLLASELLTEYEKLGVPIRSIVFREGEHGDYYYINREAAKLQIPALISEFCFIDNEEDQKFIDSDEDWQAQARAQCTAILRYFEQVDY